jgi:hypothetical protein
MNSVYKSPSTRKRFELDQITCHKTKNGKLRSNFEMKILLKLETHCTSCHYNQFFEEKSRRVRYRFGDVNGVPLASY